MPWLCFKRHFSQLSVRLEPRGGNLAVAEPTLIRTWRVRYAQDFHHEPYT